MKLKSFSNKDRYGNMFSIEFFEPDTTIPMMMMIPDMPDGYNGADNSSHPGGPKGTDTVPAWLTPGENVVNAEASRLPGNQEKIDEMNEQGRAIQQAQGGPIPTYEADGGTVYAADGAQVYTKRMPNGRMGVWKGNTFLNYVQEENDGMLKSLRDKIGWGKDSSWSLFNSDGGQVPAVYAADGADADELLRKFLELEEGKRNTAYLDSAGVPTIGFGSTRGVKMGDKIDDAQARQKLMADMRVAEEDYNKLVTADLNPNQQTAVKSLLFNIGGPQFANSKARAALNAGDFDAFQKEASEFRMADGKVLPGLEARRAREMSLFNKPLAQAVAEQQTADKPSIIPPVVGMLGDQKVYSDDMGKFVITPEGESYLDNNQLRAAGFEVPPVAETPPKPYVEDFGDPESMTLVPADPSAAVAETQAAERTAIEVMETGNAANNARANAKAERDKLEDMRKRNVSPTVLARQVEITKAANAEEQTTKAANNAALVKQENENKAQAEKVKRLSEEAEAVAKGIPPKVADTKSKTKTVNDIISKTKSAVSVKEKDKDVTDKGKDALSKDPTFASQIAQGFKDLFGEMFSPKELARMIVNYAGSRALGYDHNASLNYSAKTYTKTLAAQRAQIQKDIRSELFVKTYTKDSLDNYAITGDRDVLIEKESKAKKVVPGDYYVVPGMTGMQAAVDVDGVPMLTVKVNGKLERVNAASIGAKKVIPENSPIELAKSFDSAAEQAFKRVNKGVKEENQLVPLTSLGGAARDLVMEDIAKEAADTSNQGRIKTAMRRALDKYADANLQFKKDKTSFDGRDPVDSLLYFYRQERIAVDNPGLNMKYVEGADPYKLADLMNTVQQEVDQSKTDAKVEFKAMNNKWNKILERKRKDPDYNMGGFEDKKRTDGHTAFTWWMSQIYANNPTAEQLFNDN